MFTYIQVMDSARVKLRDKNKTRVTDADLLNILVDGVQTIYKLGALTCPAMFRKSSDVALTVLGSYGPYALPTDVLTPLQLEDDYGQALEITSREAEGGSYGCLNRSGAPQYYWFEGFTKTGGNMEIYFNCVPDKSRTYKFFYIPSVARVSVDTGEVPLPDFFFEPLDVWSVKIAGQMDEYATMDEDQKMQLMLPLVNNILIARAEPIGFTVSGVGF